MAVTVDASGIEVGSGPVQATSPLDVTGVITVGSGAKALLVTIVFDGTNTNVMPTSITCTWDQGGTNQAMTQVGILNDTSTGLNNNADGLVMFGLLNPTAGNKTIRFTWTNTTVISQWDVSAMSFIGNDLTSIANAFQFATSNSPGTANATSTITATSAVGAITVCLTTENFTSSTGPSSPNHTQLYAGSMSNNRNGVQYSNGASSLTFTWTLGTTVTWNNLVVSVMPALDPSVPYDMSAKPFRVQRAQIDLSKATNLNLFKNPIPLGPYDYSSGPRRVFDFLPDASKPLNLNLFKNPIPFGPFDYNHGPAEPMWKLPTAQPYNISLYQVVTNAQVRAPYLGRSPLKLPASVPFDVPYNPNLYSGVVQAPFFQSAWGEVFFPQTPPIGSAPLNINLFTNPIPFGPFDLSDSVRFPLVPQSSQPYNQSLYTVTITLMGQAWI